jgi:hypothetical protein
MARFCSQKLDGFFPKFNGKKLSLQILMVRNFCSSKLDVFFPKLDLKISSQTLRVQELLSKA